MKIAFISCVKTKRNYTCKAQEMYISDLFKKSLNYRKNNYDKTYILSAKYGLLELNDIIHPYEKTLNNMSRIELIKWYNIVLKQINVDIKDELYFHCGIKYRSGLINLLVNKCHIPLKGLGLGNQLKFYKQNTDQLKINL